MANPYYTPSGTPGTSAQGSSSDIRSEFALIQAGLDKLPALTGDFVVVVNAGGTALVPVASLTVAQGGTGVATLTDGGILLGSGTGAITALAVLADGEMVVGDGTTDPSIESGATLRTSIGVGTGDNVTFTNVTGTGVGTFASLVLTTDLPVTHGGTGASTLTDGGILLGSGTGAITATAVLADGEMIVGDGTTDPAIESGATLRTSIGLGSLAEQNTINNGDWSGTDLAVANGGTGASTFPTGSILLGNSTSAIGNTGVLADGDMIVGDGVGAPVRESGATLRTSIGVGTSDNVSFAGITGSGILSIDSATDSTSTTTGSIHTDGGLGVVKNIHCNGNLFLSHTVASNTRLGDNSGESLAGGALRNTSYGGDSLAQNVSGDDNTAIGYASLKIVTGIQNTAVGQGSSESITSGSNTTAIGFNALTLNTASDSTAVGALALDANTSGQHMTAVGKGALSATVTAFSATAVGKEALLLSTGNFNTAVGAFAGDAITSGTQNTILGYDSDTGSATSTHRIVIGAGVIGTANDQVSIGKASNIVSNDFGTDAVWTRASDERKKQEVNPLMLGLSFINDLEPITYRWKSADQYPKEWNIPSDTEIDTDTIMTGMLAQQVKKALDNANTGIRFPGWKELDNGMQQISGEAYIFPIINAVNELTARLKALEIAHA